MMSQCLIPHVQKVDSFNSCPFEYRTPSSVDCNFRLFFRFPVDCMGQECGNIIYQLGMLILELITGQSSEKGSADLIQWIQESRFRSSMHNMIDPDLGNTYDLRELRSLLAIAKLCIGSGDKPSFSVVQIFRYFQKKVDLPQWLVFFFFFFRNRNLKF